MNFKSITSSYSLTDGNYFVIQIHEGDKKTKYVRLNRFEAIAVAQQLLEGLKETKKTYNKLVKQGKIK